MASKYMGFRINLKAIPQESPGVVRGGADQPSYTPTRDTTVPELRRWLRQRGIGQ
jgi:hypothetical protein